MNMLTYNTFKRSKNGNLTIEDVQFDKIDYGKSITDKSHYKPNASSFIQNAGYSSMRPIYHFPDGVDNGLNMAAITNKNLDITEKEALYIKLKQKTGEAIEELVNQIEEMEQSDIDDKDKTSSDKEASNN